MSSVEITITIAAVAIAGVLLAAAYVRRLARRKH